MSEERLNLNPLKARSGFTLTELMVSLVIASIIVAGLYKMLVKQRRSSTIQRLKADTESIAQIAFFIIGRDIRRAGSNPAGAMGYSAAAEIPLGKAQNTDIQILADLDGNGVVSANTDENIEYKYMDSDGDGINDYVVRQSGNQLVISNVRAFDLQYQLVGTNVWLPSTNSPELVRLVRLHMKAGTGKINPDTHVEDSKEIQMDFMLRNFR
jgi:prepilin-type N-terminal cleavage/methylation domain-containing protein